MSRKESGYDKLLKKLLDGKPLTGKDISNGRFAINSFVELIRKQTSLSIMVEKIGRTTYVIPKHDLHKTSTRATLPNLHAYGCEKYLSEELPKHEMPYGEVKI